MTIAAMGVAGQELGQRLVGAQQSSTRLINREDAEGTAKLIQSLGDRIAAFIIEPVLGSGTLPVSSEVIATILAEREKHGYLVVADEVATGFGRTGPMFASDLWAERPDLLIASKALTNGTIAASALLWSPRLVTLHEDSGIPLYHAETQAGSPIPSAAIVATITEYQRLDALGQGRRTGAALEAWLNHVAGLLPGTAHEGVGCFRSLRLREADGGEVGSQRITAITEAIRRAGATVYPGPSAIQLVPALTYDPALLERHLGIVEDVLLTALAGSARRGRAA
jgi:adenosylmethionine-8-amino-7-oxononanoate aminotransferase